MRIQGEHRRSIEALDDAVRVLDQTKLPRSVEWVTIRTAQEAAHAIRAMQVRGAPLIGVTAAWGIWLALREDPGSFERAYALLLETRPTAVNLRWALDRMRAATASRPDAARAAREEAARITEEDVATCAAIGEAGLTVFPRDKRPLRIMTHCNAGWLACVDHGTALAPIYRAQDQGAAVFVWVSETRPRNQGAQLTALELGAHGVPHAIVADSACGHYLQRGEVDLCIVGADRVTARGDVANKIGTYLKALAARATNVPFWVALPTSTIDWTLEDGMDIPIEERGEREVLEIAGVRVAPEGSRARNPAFDVTPAHLITGYITERGVVDAAGLRALRAT